MSNELYGTALKVGPHATGCVKPRQARKGATVRRPSRVPWEYLAGAGSVRRSGGPASTVPRISTGCAVTGFSGTGRKMRTAGGDSPADAANPPRQRTTVTPMATQHSHFGVGASSPARRIGKMTLKAYMVHRGRARRGGSGAL